MENISPSFQITEVLNFAVRQISDVEANIVSVERVKEYSETPNEVIPSTITLSPMITSRLIGSLRTRDLPLNGLRKEESN